MKATRLITALAGLTLGASAFASTSTVSMSDVRDALKASPVGLSFLHTADLQRDDNNELSGNSQLHIAYLKYQVTDKDRLQLSNRLSRKNLSGKDVDYSYARMVLKYTRSGVLTQAEHGINLKINLEKRYYPDKDERHRRNAYGLNRLSASVSRSMGQFNFSGTAYVAVSDRIDKSVSDTTTHYLYAVLTQSYRFNDKWSLSLTEELFQTYNTQLEDYRGGQAGIAMTLELGRSISPAVYAGISISATPFAAYDGQLLADNITEKFGIGGSLYWSAF